MAGVEIVLAILPLVVSTLEHYSDATTAYQRYKHYGNTLLELQESLRIRRTIFHNDIIILLSTVVSKNEASNMVDDHRHPNWMDNEVESALRHLLQTSFEPCFSLISNLNRKLEEIEAEEREFAKIVDQNSRVLSLGNSLWRQAVSRKLSLAFSKSRLQERMEDLRRMTDDLGRVIDQTQTLRHNVYSQPEQRYRRFRSERLENLRAAGKVAQALASALDVACERHPQHQALLCLDPDLEGWNANSDNYPWIDVESSLLRGPIKSRPHRRNETAPLRLSATDAQPREAPVLVSSNVVSGAAPVTRRHPKKQPEHTKHSLGNIFRNMLIVQSANGGGSSRQAQSQRDLGRLSHVSVRSHQILQGPSRQADEPSDNNQNNKNDRERLSGSTQAAASYLSPTESPPGGVNVIGKDFCARLQSFRSLRDRQNPFIGNLRTPDTVLAASISHASSLQALYNPASTLANILNNIRHRQGSGTEPSPAPYHKRLLWAKQLSRSVLLFHNSPWLPRSFSSKSIYLRETPGERHVTSGGMYIEKSFGDADGRNAHPPSARHFVSNPYLFGLGVLLLELGFEASCELLSTPEDEAQANGTLGNLEFFTANRLTAIASQTLGMKYASIAKKCLQCDFGCGNDLKDPVLQEAVYRQVYCQLEEMEQGVREILGMVETPH